MDPTALREWGEAVGIPTILAGILLGVWRICSYIAKNFLTPLGGPDGKIAQFLDANSDALRELPKVIGELNQSVLAFGSETNSALRDLLRAKRLLGEMIDNVAASVDADVSEQRNELSRLLNGHAGRDQPK